MIIWLYQYVQIPYMTQASAALSVSQVGTQRGAAAVGGAIYMLNGLVKANIYRKPCLFFSTNYRGSCRFSLSPIQWYAENPAIIFRCWIIDDWIDWSQNSGLNHILFWDCELTHSRNTVYATTSTKGWDRNSSKWFPTSNGSGHGFKVILPIIFRGRNFQPSSN